ncbi:hypothetical protein [Specibacter sp. NPDC078692]|uniref:hypothetical protein n=1 Tax=Specibacter sp. NPDC078692 TaxID=3155818 RepID=UPI00342FD15F
MKQLVHLRKSRFLQIIASFLALVIVAAVVYMSVGARILPAMGISLLSLIVGILASRVIQLEWKVATTAKSINTRNVELDARFDSLKQLLRNEFRAQPSVVGPATTIEKASPVKHAPVAAKNAPVMPSATGQLVIGRTAASVPESVQRQSVLFDLLNHGSRGGSRPNLTGVLSRELKDVLQGQYQVTELSPSVAREQIARSGPTQVVIDQRAFESGAWFGADAATGTLLFTELAATIELAKSSGIPVWFIATDSVPSPYTNEYRRLATSVFGFNSSEAAWDEGLSVRFLDAVNEYLAGVQN